MCPLVKFSALVTRMSGKLNGSVFAFNQGGDYFRNNKQGKGKTSPRWQHNKSAWGTLAGQWRLLTDEQRAAWVAITPEYPTLNRFGVSRTPTGYELFMRLNGAMVANALGCCLTPDNPEEEDDFGIITPVTSTNTSPFGVTFQAVNAGAIASTNINADYSGVVLLDAHAGSVFDSTLSDAANIAILQPLLPNYWTINVVSTGLGTWDITLTLDPNHIAIGGTIGFAFTDAGWTATTADPIVKPTMLITLDYANAVGDHTAVCAYAGSYQAKGSRIKRGLLKRMANQIDNSLQHVDISVEWYNQFGAAILGGTIMGYLRMINTHTGQQYGGVDWVITFPI